MSSTHLLYVPLHLVARSILAPVVIPVLVLLEVLAWDESRMEADTKACPGNGRGDLNEFGSPVLAGPGHLIASTF